MPWWEGSVAGQPVALCGRFGPRGFTGELVVGGCAGAGRLCLERPDARWRAPLAHETLGDHLLPAPMLDLVMAAAANLSRAVLRVEVCPTGSRCTGYGPARAETVVADAMVLAGLTLAVAQLPDPAILAAVKAHDLAAVRERLTAGDDPRMAGPRDRQYPGELGCRPERPLLVALTERELEIARELLTHGALHDADGWPAFALAVGLGDLDLLDTLLTHGGVGAYRYELATALADSVGRGWVEGVRRLLAAGADPSAVQPPRGQAAREVRTLLEQAKAERLQAGGPLAVAAERERGLPGATGRWQDRALALLPGVRRRVRRAWLDAAVKLVLGQAHGPGPGRLVGDLDGMPVQVEVARAGPRTLTRITVGGLPPWFSLRPETLREKLGLTTERFMEPTAASQWRKTNDVITGDYAFDERIDVKGPVADCLPLLSHQVRRQIVAFVDVLEGRVEAGLARLERSGVVDDAGRLVLLVRAAHQLAAALAVQLARGPLTCLADIARTDPLETVRAMMLGARGERFPNTPETQEAARLAVTEGRYDWYRMAGASLLGEEGTTFYRKTLADPSQSPSVRGMALRHLGFRLEDAAEELILSHLVAPEREIVLHAVQVLGERAGTARSVVPLQEVAGPLPVSEVARAAARSVEMIQSRLAHAAPGQVSLVATDREGELALAPSRLDDSRPDTQE